MVRKAKKKAPADLNRIAIVLVELKVTQRELGAGIGRGEVMISRYCTNTAQPSLEVLNDIANFLKVDVRRLMVPNKYAKAEQSRK